MDIISDPTPECFDDMPVKAAVTNSADQVVWQKSATLNWGNIYGDRRSSRELLESYDLRIGEAWFQLLPPVIHEDEEPPATEEPLPEAGDSESIPTDQVTPSEPLLDTDGNVVTLNSQTEAP